MNQLSYLNLANNNLTDLERYSFDMNANLSELHLRNNNLKTLPTTVSPIVINYGMICATVL